MERYIGLDAHAMSCTFAVVGERGRRLQSTVVATNGRALVEFLKTVPGRRHLCLEEGTQNGWLYEILAPRVDECVVTALAESRGAKDDRRDAFTRAQELRLGAVRPIFKGGTQFSVPRCQAAVYGQVTADVVRVQNLCWENKRSSCACGHFARLVCPRAPPCGSVQRFATPQPALSVTSSDDHFHPAHDLLPYDQCFSATILQFKSAILAFSASVQA